ncbi:hypothetical protein B0I35DRAFT_412854 [Stachybotrys elegans]|uniref:PD-(D/E)XK nuclease-like domain-containing protein n=1 Tax=Stachybotrys elegans TaxID=80388 RepID=A0A8K0SMN6_9HYPO|nr:hypothetical protein B0I35DRAFT_412854 [Stachybotrys elegans]
MFEQTAKAVHQKMPCPKPSRPGKDDDCHPAQPITVSIETKKSEGFEEVVLQIGVWHAAHWTYLDRIAKKRNTHLDGLEFLPGLIVSGADWYFVASTRQGHKTTLWKKTVDWINGIAHWSLQGCSGDPVSRTVV